MADFVNQLQHETSQPTILVDAGLEEGFHVFQLVVLDADGLASAPAQVTVRVRVLRPPPGPIEPSPIDPRLIEPRPIDTRPIDTRPIEPQPIDTRPIGPVTPIRPITPISPVRAPAPSTEQPTSPAAPRRKRRAGKPTEGAPRRRSARKPARKKEAQDERQT